MRKGLLPALLAAALLATGAAPATAGWRVLRDDARATVVQVEFSGWESLRTPSGVRHRPATGLVDDRPGGPATPFERRLLALAADQPPRIVVEEVVWGSVRQGAPAAGGNDSLRLGLPHLSRGPLVQLDSVRTWRRHRIASLHVVAGRTEGGLLRPVSRIRFRIEHPPADRPLVTREDRLVEAAVLNPAAARRWALPRIAAPGRGLASARNTFPSGTLIRVEVEQEGIYEISRADLIARGIDLSGVDPRTLRLYGNGGQMLPRSYATPRDSTLRENAIIVTGEEDGSFDPGDRILFYGRSVNTWLPYQPTGGYRHNGDGQANPFTRRNVYWLVVPDDFGEGKRMASLEAEEAVTFEAQAVRSRTFQDIDAFIFNYRDAGFITESGLAWFTARLSGGEDYTTSFQANSPLQEAEAKLVLSFERLSGYQQEAVLIINSVPVDTFDFAQTLRSFDLPAGLLHDGQNELRLLVQDGEILFDWFEISYWRRLSTTLGRMEFDAFPEDGVASVELEGLEQPWIFDVQDFDDVGYTRANPYRVNTQVNSPRRTIAVSDGAFLRPPLIEPWGVGGPEYPRGLRDAALEADYLIITHADFFETAASLESYIEGRDGIEVMRVRTDDIYDEFGWGLFDPTAIRDFLAFAQAGWAVPPTTVLLAGDGDYDYRNIVSDNDENWVPPYENGSECRDDWYVSFTSSVPEMIVSRLTVQSNAELETYIDKLNRYENESDLGAWRGRIVVVADDEYVDTGPTSGDRSHMRDAENLAKHIAPDYLDLRKIYIGTYPTTYDAATGGRRKPLATRDLIDVLNEGALVVNYLGHGNAHVWAHEHVLLDSRDSPLIDSGNRVPIYVAGTCSWGHFDRPDNEAHPEILLAQPGGAIAVIAATRKTYGHSNSLFISALYGFLFDREAGHSLGEALLLAKIAEPGNTNRYYHLLGEPGLVPAIPRLDLEVTDVQPDSLTALRPARVAGRVLAPDGQQLPGFEGEAVVTVFDGADTLSYAFVNSDGEPYDTLKYSVSGGTLFRGRATTTGGEFNSTFIVPRDLRYGSSAGRVRMYAYDDQRDGLGAQSGILISATSGASDDATPPEASIHFDHRRWRSGDMTSPTPTLIVDIFDTSGVNLTGEIGHDIRAVVDGTREIVLTDEFLYERDSYTRGSAEYALYDLEPGPHRIEVWAWDNANNFTRAEAEFVVSDEAAPLAIRDVLNWPNPFEERTSFTFELSVEAEVTIRIFTASGRLVKEIGPLEGRAGYNYPEVASGLRWDGRDRFGDPVANGVYLYKITARGSEGASAEALGKLLRVR